jgi:hypothetical protein
MGYCSLGDAMKQIIQNYTFNASAGTVTFTDFAAISLERVLLITNVTRNTVVYIFNTAGRGGTVSSNMLTLECDTSAMLSSDKLQITYDCADGDPTYSAGYDANGNTNINLAVKLDAMNDAISAYEKGWVPINLTSSGQVLTAPGTVKGFFVNSTSSGTIRIADALSAGSGYVGGVITPGAGQFYQYPAMVANGCYITISGTIDVTFFVRANTQA